MSLRNQPLPGLEDARIADLDAVAIDYASIRDRRMSLTEQEATLKQRALRLMKEHGKTSYKHAGITIDVIAADETIKVKVPTRSVVVLLSPTLPDDATVQP